MRRHWSVEHQLRDQTTPLASILCLHTSVSISFSSDIQHMHLSPLARLLHSDGVPHHIRFVRSSWLFSELYRPSTAFFFQHDTPRISNPFIFHVETTLHPELSARHTLQTSKEQRSRKHHAHHIRPPFTLLKATPAGQDKTRQRRLRMMLTCQ
jgi:hypothetical protein